MAEENTPARPTQAEAEDQTMFADAALRLAGHDVTDPELRAILDAQSREEITGDEARARLRKHIQG